MSQEPAPQESESLISEEIPEAESSSYDDNFMASLGDAVDFGSDDEEPETQHLAFTPTTDTEPELPAPEPAPVPAPKTPETAPEEQEEEAHSTIWNTIIQVLLGLLIIVGIMLLLQLHSITDKITAATLYDTVPAAQRYDYAVDRVSDADMTSHMALRGIEGWRLVSYQRTTNIVAGDYGYELIFTRNSRANF